MSIKTVTQQVHLPQMLPQGIQNGFMHVTPVNQVPLQYTPPQYTSAVIQQGGSNLQPLQGNQVTTITQVTPQVTPNTTPNLGKTLNGMQQRVLEASATAATSNVSNTSVTPVKPASKRTPRVPKVVDPNKVNKVKSPGTTKKTPSKAEQLSIKVQVSKCTDIVKSVLNDSVKVDLESFKEANKEVFARFDELVKKRSEITKNALQAYKSSLPVSTPIDKTVKRDKTPEEIDIKNQIDQFVANNKDVFTHLKTIKLGTFRINSKASMILALLVDRTVEKSLEWGLSTLNGRKTLDESIYNKVDVKSVVNTVLYSPIILKNLDNPLEKIKNDQRRKMSEKTPKKGKKDSSTILPQQQVDANGNIVSTGSGSVVNVDGSARVSGNIVNADGSITKCPRKKRVIDPSKSPFHPLINNKFKVVVKPYNDAITNNTYVTNEDGTVSNVVLSNKSSYKLGGYTKELLSLVINQFLYSFSLMLKHMLLMGRVRTVSYEIILNALKVYFISADDVNLLHYNMFDNTVKQLIPPVIKEKKPRPPKKTSADINADNQEIIKTLPEDVVSR